MAEGRGPLYILQGIYFVDTVPWWVGSVFGEGGVRCMGSQDAGGFGRRFLRHVSRGPLPSMLISEAPPSTSVCKAAGRKRSMLLFVMQQGLKG
jgi:hypothetical protein